MRQLRIKRIKELDGLRGLAILSVVLFHYTTRFDQIYGHDQMIFSFKYGHFGVQLFFMLSGYVIYLSIQKISNISDFIIRRFSRLYPSYWASIILTFIIVTTYGLPGREASIIDVMFNLTMLQDFLSSNYFRINQVDGAYWTLSRFVVFYFFIGLVIFFKKKDKITLICTVWTVLIIAIDILDKNIISIPSKLYLLFLVREASFFMIGMMFFLMKNITSKLFPSFVVLLNLAAIFYISGVRSVVFATFFSILFILAINGKLEFLTQKIFIFLGTISYSLYLVHQNIGYVIIRKLYLYIDNFLIIIIIPFAISIILAFVITYYVEKPIMKIIREYLKN